MLSILTIVRVMLGIFLPMKAFTLLILVFLQLQISIQGFLINRIQISRKKLRRCPSIYFEQKKSM